MQSGGIYFAGSGGCPILPPEWAGEGAKRWHPFCRVKRGVPGLSPEWAGESAEGRAVPLPGCKGGVPGLSPEWVGQCRGMGGPSAGVQRGCPGLISRMGRRECRGAGSPSAGVQRGCPRLISRMGRRECRGTGTLCRVQRVSQAYLPNWRERVQRDGQSFCRGSKGVPTFSSLSFSRPKGALNPLGFGLP